MKLVNKYIPFFKVGVHQSIAYKTNWLFIIVGKLISKAKLYDKEIEVYHTLWYTEHIYPGTIPNSVFSMFELKDYDFVDEYNVKDNSHERIKWKLDFYHRLFNVERRKEALEAAKDESEKLKKMITDLRD